MSCEATTIFFEILAYIPHIRKNHSTFPHIATKTKLKKVISTVVPGFYQISLINKILVQSFLKSLRLLKGGQWIEIGNLGSLFS
jgi:hypothetical protein